MLACGIDFGTSNSLAATAGPEGISICEVDPVNSDAFLLPSLLYFSRYGWNRVGRAATHAYQADPDGRFIRSLKSALPEHTPEESFRAFKEHFTLPELLGFFFGRVKESLEVSQGKPVTRATVGRPVRFSADPIVDRRAEKMLRAAANTAGFTNVRFLSEPEAATRFYHAGGGVAPESTVLVFDFGGGTLDLCLARFGRGGYKVLGTAGAHIGGTLLDRILFEEKLLPHLGLGVKWGRGLDLPVHIFNRLLNPDANWRITDADYASEVRHLLNATVARGAAASSLRLFHTVAQRRLGPDLFAAIEAAKVRLSSVDATEIRFETEGVSIVEPLTRSDLRVLFSEPLNAIRQLITECLEAARRTPADVDRVLLAGGSSGLICTQELLRELFGEERVPVRQDLFTSIVSGLALDAAAGERRSAMIQ